MGILGKNDSFDYFQGFVSGAKSANEAANCLLAAFEDFHADRLQEYAEALHHIENEADTKKHDLTRNLAREFVTPIEREDIAALSHEIDNIVDSIEEVMRRIYMYNITSLRSDAVEIARHIVRCTETFVEVAEEFVNFKKSKSLIGMVIQVNTLESEGDVLHMNAIRALHTSPADAQEKFAWTLLYNSLEECFDACEHAADVVERVIMNNI